MPGPHQQPQYITRALDQEVILLVASPSSQAAVTRQVSVGGGDPPRRGGGPGPGHRPVSTHCDTTHSVLEAGYEGRREIDRQFGYERF